MGMLKDDGWDERVTHQSSHVTSVKRTSFTLEGVRNMDRNFMMEKKRVLRKYSHHLLRKLRATRPAVNSSRRVHSGHISEIFSIYRDNEGFKGGINGMNERNIAINAFKNRKITTHAFGNKLGFQGDPGPKFFHPSHNKIIYKKDLFKTPCSPNMSARRPSKGLLLTIFFGRLLTILLTLSLLPSSVSGGGLTLNIAREPEGKKLSKVESVKEGIRYTNFTVRKKNYITRIVDTAYLIWQAQSVNELCTSFTIYTFHRGHKLAYARIDVGKARRFAHYKFTNPGWESITHAEYMQLFDHRSSSLVFDVSARHNIDLFKITFYEPFGKPAFIFHPRATKKIRYIMDGHLMLWRYSEREPECTSVVVHKEGIIPRYMQLIIKNGDVFDNRFLERFGHMWEFISKESFYKKVDQTSETSTEKPSPSESAASTSKGTEGKEKAKGRRFSLENLRKSMTKGGHS
ncbi:hypothetical protein BEWA_047780 [Theileria equi strain WA]|uniref:Signal peptide containing protein n=1 Tax=Theileria equi strain WA TaxID=1537102 RepID=L1LAZ9_THEEQ|nr:hypothetical protein BEWA_047780 [Theileria equi strain WA]EKX72313.1 hypothetical protein BEWA_047780 [Theileria equi strain WA]|eukprot:XP_004831765.1 hypothetical protein BEWA_047780 [Theileria equi strain WA]